MRLWPFVVISFLCGFIFLEFHRYHGSDFITSLYMLQYLGYHGGQRPFVIYDIKYCQINPALYEAGQWHGDCKSGISLISLTLGQWSPRGNPVAIQCAWNLDPNVHCNATWERIVGSQCVSSVLPVVSSGFPVVFQCVPIMQINTGLPLGHHWVLASASVVPVASQCTCGSSGLPVCSNYSN